MSEIIIPSIDEQNKTVTPDGIIISDCKVLDNGNISGYTSDGTKALYDHNKNKWLIGGKAIRENNLINLKERTKDERLSIIDKANESKRRNNEQKRNINELAKAMLEQALSDRQKQEIVGERDYTLDNTLASALLNAMINSALDGSFKAFESVRDTAGFKPKNEVEIQADIMTESDRALIDKVSKVG